MKNTTLYCKECNIEYIGNIEPQHYGKSTYCDKCPSCNSTMNVVYKAQDEALNLKGKEIDKIYRGSDSYLIIFKDGTKAEFSNSFYDINLNIEEPKQLKKVDNL